MMLEQDNSERDWPCRIASGDGETSVMTEIQKARA